jgi:hypothetical protein
MNGRPASERRRPHVHTEPVLHRRVVVTGIGIATPWGSNLDTFWSAIFQGQSCISEITRLDTADPSIASTIWRHPPSIDTCRSAHSRCMLSASGASSFRRVLGSGSFVPVVGVGPGCAFIPQARSRECGRASPTNIGTLT